MDISQDLLICGTCEESFSFHSITQFIEHKMLHVDANKRIGCCLCSKVFQDRISLQKHLEQFHSISKEICDNVSEQAEKTCLSSFNTLIVRNKSDYTENGSPLSCEDKSLVMTSNRTDNTTNSEQCLLDPMHSVCDNLKRRRESFENSNSSHGGVFSIVESPNEIQGSHVPHFDHGYCNGSFTPTLLNNKSTVTPESTSISSKPRKQSHENSKSSTAVLFCNNKKSQVKSGKDCIESFVTNEGGCERGIQSKNETLSQIGKDVDFHFLLGTTCVKGNSMTYERVEFKCMHCSFSSAWRPSLVKHMKNTHNDILAFHEILSIQNTTPMSDTESDLSNRYKIMRLSDHTRVAHASRKHKSKSRKRSIEFQDIPGKYTCPICNKVFSRFRYMRRHQMTHRAPRTYLCNNCGKSFKTKATLLAHNRTHDVKIYNCPQCDFVSSSSGAIHRHRQLHPNGAVVCDICGTVYIDKSTLKKHRRVHDPIRPFSCPINTCTWRFNTESLMKAHARSHTVEGKFQCSYCGYRFRHKHHLQRHISKIHSDGLLENSASQQVLIEQPLSIAKSTPISELSGPSAVTVIPLQQDIAFNFNYTNPNSELLNPVLSSRASEPQHPHTLSFGEQIEKFDDKDCKADQNTIQLLVEGEHNIVINLQTEHNLEMPNSGVASLECNTTDEIQQLNLGQVFIIKK